MRAVPRYGAERIRAVLRDAVPFLAKTDNQILGYYS